MFLHGVCPKMRSACIITNGKLDQIEAKTAHGLIRGTERFDIIGVIDAKHAGLDAGEVLDGQTREILVYSSMADLLEKSPQPPEFAIIGAALSGGMLPEDWNQTILEAMELGISIINGLHQPIGEKPEFKAAMAKNETTILNIRQPKPISEMHFYTGAILSIETPIIAVLGMDCAIGKRTTAWLIGEMCRDNGIPTEIIYTGQTGWMKGGDYGFIFDATPNDFVCGELEHAIVSCVREKSPELILIEGQSGLRNPLGPCGSEFIVSGRAKGVILQHAPFRTFYDDLEEFGCRIPDVAEEINLIEMLGAETLALTLNCQGGGEQSVIEEQNRLIARLGIPVVRPLEEGVEALLELIKGYMQGHAAGTIQ
jgi:uncharacterized NAD-dependent epimerase/dehydratase family protein